MKFIFQGFSEAGVENMKWRNGNCCGNGGANFILVRKPGVANLGSRITSRLACNTSNSQA